MYELGAGLGRKRVGSLLNTKVCKRTIKIMAERIND